MPSNCALLGRFAIGARVALLWQHNANANAKLKAVSIVSITYTQVAQRVLFSSRPWVDLKKPVSCSRCLNWRFLNDLCKTVCPMLSDRCLSVCLSVLSPLSCPVCDVRALWPNGWIDQDETWHADRPRPWPHCVRCGPSSHSPKGHNPQFSADIRCGQMAA